MAFKKVLQVGPCLADAFDVLAEHFVGAVSIQSRRFARQRCLFASGLESALEFNRQFQFRTDCLDLAQQFIRRRVQSLLQLVPLLDGGGQFDSDVAVGRVCK